MRRMMMRLEVLGSGRANDSNDRSRMSRSSLAVMSFGYEESGRVGVMFCDVFIL